MKVYQLEVTNACNLKCSFCPRTEEWARRPSGMMQLDLIFKIDWTDTEYVELQLSGEPTLHPQIESIVNILKSIGLKVGMSTNEAYLSEKLLESLDSITINNDEHRTPKHRGQQNVRVQSLGDDMPIEDYTHKKPLTVYPECITPLDYVSIQWNGNVVPCCKAHGPQPSFGNLYFESWSEIINGTKREQFLIALREKQFNGLCEYCQYPNPHEIHKKILKEINRRP